MKLTDAEPRTLLDAFRAMEAENLGVVAVLLVDEGWNAESMRVLASWPRADLSWSKPPGKIPDDGKPTAKAWAWICAGLTVDFDRLAAAADVVPRVAREKVKMLLGAGLVYPDGSLSKPARAALNECVKAKLMPDAAKPKRKARDSGDGSPEDVN